MTNIAIGSIGIESTDRDFLCSAFTVEYGRFRVHFDFCTGWNVRFVCDSTCIYPFMHQVVQGVTLTESSSAGVRD